MPQLLLEVDPTAAGDADAEAWADLFCEEWERAGKHIAGLREFRGSDGQG